MELSAEYAVKQQETAFIASLFEGWREFLAF